MVKIASHHRYVPRKEKEKKYEMEYGEIPNDPEGRINYIIDKYNLSAHDLDIILDQRNNMINHISYSKLKIIQFLEIPVGTGRPRSKIVTRKNFHTEAMKNPQFIQVYSEGASDDQNYIHQLMAKDLLVIDRLIYTPVTIVYNAYYPTPNYYTPAQMIQAEAGLDIPNASKPDFDNFCKKYSDMFNENVWADDAMVVDATIHKFYSIKPRVEIQVSYMNMLCNIYQYRKMIKRKLYDGLPISYLDKRGEIINAV